MEIDDILKAADFFGMGFYQVKETGEFIFADSIARDILGIPQNLEEDLSKHSIAELYILPADRERKIKMLDESGGKPISSILSLRIHGEEKLIFNFCWRCRSNEGECVAGLIKPIEDRVLFPKLFDDFPMGVYELDDEGKIVYYNRKALNIFGYTESQKKEILFKNIAEYFVRKADMLRFRERIKIESAAQEVLEFKKADDQIMELECFTSKINELTNAQWGMIHDVTKRERYFRALDKMPTGYFYIEYDKDSVDKHRGRIIQCNEQFAKIHGVSKEQLIGHNVERFHLNPEESEKFYKLLDIADQNGLPVLNYPFKIRKENGEIVHVAIDARLVKRNGVLVGREGTIRDISEEVKLQQQKEEAEMRLQKTTADINNLIHTFLHPVMKFSGNSELFHQVAAALFKSIQPKASPLPAVKELGKELLFKLNALKNNLRDIDKEVSYTQYRENIQKSNQQDALKIKNFKEKLEDVISNFDNSLSTEKSTILLGSIIRDTALVVMDGLISIGHFDQGKLKSVVKEDFVEFLQNILFTNLMHGVKTLGYETEIMKREVEALRANLDVKKERPNVQFFKHNIGKMVEENIDHFRAALLAKNIEIDYKSSGNLSAEVLQNEIDRVISNLLHNALKYSYTGSGKYRFLRIRLHEVQPGDLVELSIESFGVPIKRGELEQGKIFEFGYRGEMVYAVDRDGTGMGLADAKEVIKKHNGKITIISRPVRYDGNPPEYKVPYLTRVEIRIPKKR